MHGVVIDCGGQKIECSGLVNAIPVDLSSLRHEMYSIWAISIVCEVALG